ncbi:unnamed protein product [Rotaria sp. Silwood1]|nr:unnamed protein product [Rotaria sp. Silwood1]
MDDVEIILTILPTLTHFRLFGLTCRTDPSLFDGFRWENFIQTKLPLLNQFEFCLTRLALTNQDCTTMESLIAPFRTPFWLQIKHWVVKYDYECDKIQTDLIERMKKLLSSMLSRNDFRKLKLGNGDDIIENMRWPIRCRLENMTIAGRSS